MKKSLLAFLCLTLFCFTAAPAQQTQPAPIRDIYPDTWVGTDALGRSMPDISTVGPVKTDQRRVAGMFYITWHVDNLANMKSPYAGDVSKVLAADPSARLDGTNPHWTEGSYHWGEPEMGYFLSNDEYVIRHDMSMLSDAGVDVLVMDVTNAVCYWDQWKTTFSVMEKMKVEGNKVPQFCFWAFNGPVIQVVQDLYDRIYKTQQYKDLWFQRQDGNRFDALQRHARSRRRPDGHRGSCQLFQRGQRLFHLPHHVVGLLPVGRQAIRWDRGQLPSFWLRPRRQKRPAVWTRPVSSPPTTANPKKPPSHRPSIPPASSENPGAENITSRSSTSAISRTPPPSPG